MKSLFKMLVLGLTILLLGSCSQEEKLELNKMQGDLVVLKVGIDGIEEKVPGSLNTKSGIMDTLIGVSDMGNGLMLESRLIADVSARGTKFGGGNNLNSNSKILAMVYKLDGTPYKYQYLSTNNPEIMLPPGHSFKIVFYSYNSAVDPVVSLEGGIAEEDGNGGFTVPADASFKDLTETSGSHALFARIENTGVISQMTKLPNILFTPLFSRLHWVLYTDGGSNITVSGAKLNSAYAEAVVYTSRIHDILTLQHLWIGVGTANTAIDLNFAQSSGAQLTSDKYVFIPDEANVTTLSSTIDQVNISYSLDKLERGVSYKVVSKVVPKKYNVVFESAANGSISRSGIAEGSVGQTVSSTATVDAGYVFDGWYDGPNRVETTSGEVSVSGTSITVQLTSSTNNKTFVAKFEKYVDIDEEGLAAPRIHVVGTGDYAKLMLTKDPTNYGAYFQFGSIIAWTNTGSTQQSWNPTSLPPAWSADWYYGSTSGVVAHTWEKLVDGYGDPCRLVGYTKSFVAAELAAGRIPDNGKWKTPTLDEVVSWAGLDGVNIDVVTTVNGVKGRYAGLGVDRVFLPYAGYCASTTGNIANKGFSGNYWSSTVASLDDGYQLYITDTAKKPSNNYSQRSGYSVRCVPQNP